MGEKYQFQKRQNSAGFTLVELMVVVVIIGIIIAIAIPVYNRITDRSEQAAVEANLSILDGAIMMYYASNGFFPVSDTEFGDGGIEWIINSPWQEDNPLTEFVEKFEPVSGESYAIFGKAYADQAAGVSIAGNRAFIVLENGKMVGGHKATNESSEEYYLATLPWKGNFVIAAPDKYTYIFANYEDMDEFIYSSGGSQHWESDDEGLTNLGTNNSSFLFIPNDKDEYTLSVNFKINENDGNRGGFGLFFETVLDENDQYRDTGYILQFDRGFSEIVLRRREGGNESAANILARIGNRSYSDEPKNSSIPYRDNNDWWESDKNITLTVRNSSTAGKKLVTVKLDGEDILTDFEIDSDISASNNHTGFRAWNNAPITVYDLDIKD